ncbi:hypothetical protein ACXC9Q_21515 [Kribbella sp. CWNU-51]
MDAEEDEQADQHDADDTAADHQRQLVLADATGTLGAARPARLPLGLSTLLLLPAAARLLALGTPRLLLVGTALLLRGALTPTALRGLSLRLPRTRPALLAGLGRLLPPAALLRRLPLLRRLSVRRLSVRRLSVRGLALRRLTLLGRPTLLRRLTLVGRLLRALTPAATTLAGRLLSPAALRTLSPLLPAWLAPRLPRTPRSPRRRRHIRSF